MRCLAVGHARQEPERCSVCGRSLLARGWLWRVHAVLASAPDRLGTREAVRLMGWFALMFAGLSAASGTWGLMVLPAAGLLAYLLMDTARLLWAPTATLEAQLRDGTREERAMAPRRDATVTPLRRGVTPRRRDQDRTTSNTMSSSLSTMPTPTMTRMTSSRTSNRTSSTLHGPGRLPHIRRA